uniref:Glycosyltransferase n=3 Tax=Aegilops tauschii TaxID=37682 RepID=A0A453T2E4_AEGTS
GQKAHSTRHMPLCTRTKLALAGRRGQRLSPRQKHLLCIHTTHSRTYTATQSPMAPSSTNRGRRRVVLLPLPYQGHINPMLRLAAALYSRGLAITILHPETRAPDRRKLPADYRLVTIPDNIPPELAASEDIASFVFALNKNCAAPFRDYLAGALRAEEEGEDGRVAFVVADVDWFAPLSVARELGVAALALMTSSAARFLVYQAYPSLCRKGYLPVQESNFNTAVEELPPFLVRDLDRVMDMAQHLAYADLLAHIVAGVRQSSGLIINTSEDMEGREIERIRSEITLPVIAVGPLHMMTASSSVGSSLLTEDRSCLDWLDTQQPNSVIYVSFGSLVGIDTDEFLEMAWGLADSQRPFVWVVRPGLVHGCEFSTLPEELQKNIGSRGRVVSWAPQQEVLKHPSVVAFLTHCGWNSTTEGISEGAPMICRPLSSDQMGTSRYVCDVWKVGVRLEVENQLKRGDVQAAITRLMEGKEGEEVRERMKDLRHAVGKCTDEGGTSDVALQRLVDFSV